MKSLGEQVYKEVNIGKYKGVRHFELVESKGVNLIGNKVNISKDRGFANRSRPSYWIKGHDGKKWTNLLSGLFPSQRALKYVGDLNQKSNLFIAEFGKSLNGLTLKITIENGYPFDKRLHPKSVASKIF